MLSFLLPVFLVFSANAFSAKDLQWHSLLHYKSTWFGAKEKSAIRSSDFFLSPEGFQSPEEELRATILAMGQPVTENPNKHAQCRFPARLQWLKKVANAQASLWPKVDCPDFLAYSHSGEIESISLVFATGYLSNPASYFGHPLIKFNLSRKKVPSSLLDVSVSYGAITPPDENAFVYAFKGIFGGYDGTFSHRHFYYNNHTYGEIELRDMWEYKLNLKPEEVAYFYAHAWELLGKEFTYYFLNDNCASVVAELVDNAASVRVMSRVLPYSIPYSLFDNLIELKRPDGEPIVSAVSLIPSRQTRLTTGYRSLDQEQKIVVESVVKENRVTEQFKSLSPERRKEVLETLFNYYSFRAVEAPPNSGENPHAAVKQELLVIRLQLPPDQESRSQKYELKPPHSGPKPFLSRVGGIKSSSFGNGVELQFRTSYYDFLALDFGRAKNSDVRTLDVSIDFFESFVWIRKVDLISVSTFNISQTGLPGDGGMAWGFNMGFDSLHLGCRDCSLFKIEGNYGKALPILDRQVLYAVIEVRAQTATKDSGHLAATPRLGAVVNWDRSGKLATEVSLGHRSYLNKNEGDGAIIKAETRLAFSRDWDLRLAYDKHVQELSRLSLSYYW